jgi:hypothetical protein
MFLKRQNDTNSLNVTVDSDSARSLRSFHGKKHRHHEEEFLEEGFGPMLSSDIVFDMSGEQDF